MQQVNCLDEESNEAEKQTKWLNADVQSQRKHIEMLEDRKILMSNIRKSILKHWKKRADVDKRTKREHIKTLEALSRRQNAQSNISSRNKTWLIYVLLVLLVLLGGGDLWYIHMGAPATAPILMVQHDTFNANIGQFVMLHYENILWRINTPNCLHFAMLSAFVRPVNLTTDNIKFAANIKSNVNACSSLVQ